MKKFKLFLMIAITLLLFGTIKLNASDNIFTITEFEVAEKTDGVVVNEVKLDNGVITNNVSLSNTDDYVKYKITIKNNTKSEITLKSIKDNNESENITYEFEDIAGSKIASGETKSIYVTLKYKKYKNAITLTNDPLKISIAYEGDDLSLLETIAVTATGDFDEIPNPNTGAFIAKIAIATLILGGLVAIVIIAKKNNKLFHLVLVVGISLIALPFMVKADEGIFVLSIEENKVNNTYGSLIVGIDFNVLTKNLVTNNSYNISKSCTLGAGGVPDCSINYGTSGETSKSKIESVKIATKAQYVAVKNSLTDKNIVSTASSPFEIYVWYDSTDKILYYYTDAGVILLDLDSSYLFFDNNNLTSIDFDKINTKNVYRTRYMFAELNNITDLDISSFITTNLRSTNYMFKNCRHLVNLKLPSDFRAGTVVNMEGMFYGMTDIKKLDLSGIKYTNHLRDTSHMFENDVNLEEIDLHNFWFIALKDTDYMFSGCSKLETIYASDSITVAKTTDTSVFAGCTSLVGGSGTAYSDEHKDSSYAHLDKRTDTIPGYFTYKKRTS